MNVKNFVTIFGSVVGTIVVLWGAVWGFADKIYTQEIAHLKRLNAECQKAQELQLPDQIALLNELKVELINYIKLIIEDVEVSARYSKVIAEFDTIKNENEMLTAENAALLERIDSFSTKNLEISVVENMSEKILGENIRLSVVKISSSPKEVKIRVSEGSNHWEGLFGVGQGDKFEGIDFICSITCTGIETYKSTASFSVGCSLKQELK